MYRLTERWNHATLYGKEEGRSRTLDEEAKEERGACKGLTIHGESGRQQAGKHAVRYSREDRYSRGPIGIMRARHQILADVIGYRVMISEFVVELS